MGYIIEINDGGAYSPRRYEVSTEQELRSWIREVREWHLEDYDAIWYDYVIVEECPEKYDEIVIAEEDRIIQKAKEGTATYYEMTATLREEQILSFVTVEDSIDEELFDDKGKRIVAYCFMNQNAEDDDMK